MLLDEVIFLPFCIDIAEFFLFFSNKLCELEFMIRYNSPLDHRNCNCLAKTKT